MAFAKLVFSKAPAAGVVMKAIAKVMLGETDVSAIEGLQLTPEICPYNMGIGYYKSEIINPLGETWNLEYPSGIPVTGNFALNTFTLSKQCIDPAKKKFVRFLITNTSGAFTEPVNSASTLHASTTNYHIQAQGVASIDPATGAVGSSSWRSIAASATSQSIVARTTIASNPYVIFLSWSDRHVMAMSTVSASASGTYGRNTIFLSTEFDEQPITKFSNCAPVLHISGSVVAAPLSTMTAASAVQTNTAANILNCYDMSSSAIVPVRGIQGLFSSYSFDWVPSYGGVFSSASSSPAATAANAYRSDGSARWMNAPIRFSDSNGLGTIDVTKYSNVSICQEIAMEQSILTGLDGTKYIILWAAQYGWSYWTPLMVKYG